MLFFIIFYKYSYYKKNQSFIIITKYTNGVLCECHISKQKKKK